MSEMEKLYLYLNSHANLPLEERISALFDRTINSFIFSCNSSDLAEKEKVEGIVKYYRDLQKEILSALGNFDSSQLEHDDGVFDPEIPLDDGVFDPQTPLSPLQEFLSSSPREVKDNFLSEIKREENKNETK